MSESVRASVHCQDPLLPEPLQTTECVCIMLLLLVLSDMCVYVLWFAVDCG